MQLQATATALHFKGKFVEILYSCTLTDMYCCTRSIVVLPGSLVLLLSRARNFNFNEYMLKSKLNQK